VAIERLIQFRRSLVAARAEALADAEGYRSLVVAIEDVGATLFGKFESMERYKDCFVQKLPMKHDQQEFQRLYDVVTWGRNSVMHAGNWARHMTSTAVDLALILEDSILRNVTMKDKDWKVRHVMVENPTRAEMWQTIGDVRRAMLRNSFSDIPVWYKERGGWWFVSDHKLAHWLGPPNDRRRERGQVSVGDAIADHLELDGPAELLTKEHSRSQAIAATRERPALVVQDVEGDGRTRLLGIVTAFDLL
jgi:CBS domain-containing protein